MPLGYDPNTDERFTKDLDQKYVSILSSHGFPLEDEQEKDVHKLGLAIGGELNYYLDQCKQLYLQSKLSLALGTDLDNYGTQFGVNRRSGEDDEKFRLRLLSVFSPKKVTRPNIESALQTFDLSPTPELFEPWRDVVKYDTLDHYDYRYDTGPWYMWSPDYWRSGVLVVESGWTSSIYGTTESLVNAGVYVWYEQFLSATPTESDILPDTHSYMNSSTILPTHVFQTFWFDINQQGSYDDILSNYDSSVFTISPTYFSDKIYSKSSFALSYDLGDLLSEGVWDNSEWDIAEWPNTAANFYLTALYNSSYENTNLRLYYEDLPGDYIQIIETYPMVDIFILDQLGII